MREVLLAAIHIRNENGGINARMRRFIIFVILMALLMGASNCASNADSTTTTQVPGTIRGLQNGHTSTTAVPRSTYSVNNTPLLEQNGNGSGTTSQFLVTHSAWIVYWSFDNCVPNALGQFLVVVTRPSAIDDPRRAPIQATDVSNAGTMQYSGPGTFTLSVSTSCAWSIVVKS